MVRSIGGVISIHEYSHQTITWSTASSWTIANASGLSLYSDLITTIGGNSLTTFNTVILFTKSNLSSAPQANFYLFGQAAFGGSYYSLGSILKSSLSAYSGSSGSTSSLGFVPSLTFSLVATGQTGEVISAELIGLF